MIYAGIDIGTDTIKIILCEYVNNKLNVLASTNTRTVGIKKGIVIDKDMLIKSLNLALDEIEKQSNIRLDKAIITIPGYDVEVGVYNGLSYTDGTITGNDIINCFKSAIKNNIDNSREVVTVFPINFTIDDDEVCHDPKNMDGYKLESRVLVSTVPKELINPYLEVCNECNLEVIDLSLGPICDYYQASREEFKQELGAVINIGYAKTELAIFNKGLMIKSDILPIGSRKIDSDIKYIYHLDKITSRDLKENFALSSSRYASNDDQIEITTIENTKKVINQLEISQIMEARLEEILKSVKSSLNNLTNKEISYIIITGGVSNSQGFSYLVENIFGDITYVMNMNNFGVRNNIYSTVYGLIKYYKDKLDLRGISYTMYDNIFVNNKNIKKKGIINDNLLKEIDMCLKDN